MDLQKEVNWKTIDPNEFRANVKGLWPSGLKVSLQGELWNVTLPNGVTIEVSDQDENPIDWSEYRGTDQATSRLWIRSLIYLPALAMEGHSKLVTRILSSYMSFLVEAFDNPEFFRTDSLDHCLALNLQILSELRLQEREGVYEPDRDVLPNARELALVELLESACRDPRVYRPTNHGMLILVSLLDSRFFWPELEEKRGPLGNDIEVLKELLDVSFTSEGVTVENTPSYQELWVLLVRQAAYLVNLLDDSAVISGVIATLSTRIERAFQLMLLPNSWIPPLGDGVRVPSARITDSRAGRLISAEAGLYVNTLGSDYFAFKCGSASSVHKQLDDTSIYLEIDGSPVFLDMGILNYDSFDRTASRFRGQRGHTGLYFSAFDEVPQSFLYPAYGEAGCQASLKFKEAQNRDLLTGEVKINGKYELTRSVEYICSREFVVRDTATSLVPAHALQRFIIPTTTVEIGDFDVSFFVKRFKVTMEFESPIVRIPVSLDYETWQNAMVIERAIPSNGSTFTAYVRVTEPEA